MLSVSLVLRGAVPSSFHNQWTDVVKNKSCLSSRFRDLWKFKITLVPPCPFYR